MIIEFLQYEVVPVIVICLAAHKFFRLTLEYYYSRQEKIFHAEKNRFELLRFSETRSLKERRLNRPLKKSYDRGKLREVEIYNAGRGNGSRKICYLSGRLKQVTTWNRRC
ncbi:hypothetical protein ACFL35_11230 [Candidatus Riflebacteria bacterium]